MSDCIIWEKSTTKDGYGKVWVEGRCVGAHRAAFFAANGYWPNVCRHTCDVRLCINPEHLLDGTQQDNVDDMWRRERVRSRGPGPNIGMPDQREDKAAYDKERWKRIKEGTWN